MNTEQEMEDKKQTALYKILADLGRNKLTPPQQWIFDNYWDDPEFSVEVVNGKLSAMAIDNSQEGGQS